MYNVANPPKRRMYANGYYSDWFPIKSAVVADLTAAVAALAPDRRDDDGRLTAHQVRSPSLEQRADLSSFWLGTV